MKKALSLAYGLAAYVLFFGTFCYAIGFVMELLVPKGINDGTTVSLAETLAVNLGILTLFAVQHTIMARPGFKARWTRIVPKQVERSTFVAVTSLILCLLFWQWRPVTGEIWDLRGSVAGSFLQGLGLAGWVIVLLSSFMIDHFELFGVKQVLAYVRGRPIVQPSFKLVGFYKYVRHPLMVGFIVAFWSTPHMTLGHLLFAVGTTGYILVGTRIEERDLVSYIGDAYRAYQKRVPMLIPSLGRREPAAPVAESL